MDGPFSAEADAVLDERGRRCPLPIIALGRASRELPARSLVLLVADDPVTMSDVPAWCRMTGAQLEAFDSSEHHCLRYLIHLP
jgi:tRNA 2-thiouridine synthesizing protein A